MAHQVFELAAGEYLVGAVSKRWLKNPRPLVDTALVPSGETRYLDLVVARTESDRGGVFHFEEVATGTRTAGHDLSSTVESSGIFRIAVGDTYFDFPVADDSGGDEPYAIDFAGATQTAFNAWRDTNLPGTAGDTAGQFWIWDGAGTNPYIPTLQSVETNGAGTVVTLTYDWALDTGSTPAAGDFTLSPAKTISGVVVSGKTVALTVSAAFSEGDSITLDYTPGTNPLRGTTGYQAAALSGEAVENGVDTTAPTLQSAATNEAGNQILLTFSEALDDAHVPPITALPVTVAGAARALADSGVTISGETVTLALSSPVDQGEAVTVAYAQPSVASTRLQDETGNEVATFAAQAVTNSVPVNTDLVNLEVPAWTAGSDDRFWRNIDGVPAELLVQDMDGSIFVYAYNYDPPSPVRSIFIVMPQLSAAIERDAGKIVIETTDRTTLLEFDFPEYDTTVTEHGYGSPDQTEATMDTILAYTGDLVFRVTLGAAQVHPLPIEIALGEPEYTGFDVDPLPIQLDIGGTPQSCYEGTLSGNGFVFLGPIDFPFTPNTSGVVLVVNAGSSALRLAFEVSFISQPLNADFVGRALFQIRAPDGTVLFDGDFTADSTPTNYDIPYTATERDAIRSYLNSSVTIEFFKPGPAPFSPGGDASALGIELELGGPEAREGSASELQISLALGRPNSPTILHAAPIGAEIAIATPEVGFEFIRPHTTAAEIALGKPGQDGTLTPGAFDAEIEIATPEVGFEFVRPHPLGSALALAQPYGPFLSTPPMEIALALGQPGQDGTLTPREGIGAEIAIAKPTGYSLSIPLEPMGLGANIALGRPGQDGLLAPEAVSVEVTILGDIVREGLATALPIEVLPDSRPLAYSLSVPLEPRPFRLWLDLPRFNLSGLSHLEIPPLEIGLFIGAEAANAILMRPRELGARIYLDRPELQDANLRPLAVPVAVHLRAGTQAGASWPVTIPQRFLASGFTAQPEDHVRRHASAEGGRRSRRYSGGIDVVRGRMILSPSEYDVFLAFYDQQLRRGAIRFFMPHPLEEGTSALVEFVDPPSRNRTGANWEVSLSLRVIG